MNIQTVVKVRFVPVIVSISLVLQPIQFTYAAEPIIQNAGTYTPVVSATSIPVPEQTAPDTQTATSTDFLQNSSLSTSTDSNTQTATSTENFQTAASVAPLLPSGWTAVASNPNYGYRISAGTLQLLYAPTNSIRNLFTGGIFG